MAPSNSAEIRQAFLDYFQEMGHEVVSSSPLPVLDNPTLLFTNAGMNQFVDVFLGKERRSYRRAVSSQKCMRVQGKHNDLENVGPSPRHHTFFEMLGNFSFGDYFKEGAIRFAYDFLTKVCQINPDRLWYSVHSEDDEAFDIWVKQIGVPAERVLRMDDKTNFWMMGDVGPCGPTSEVHFDWGPEHCTCNEPNCSVFLDNECGRWLELWNLVFMQFNQDEEGNRTALPKPGVDTGMGLERITAVVEQEPVNYNTDLFSPAMARVQELLGDSKEERRLNQTGYRVIADHGRAATFLIGDGVLPGNVGRGYVLRMIIRRAARFGREIGFSQPFLAQVAQIYISQMGDIYPELRRYADHIENTITQEEERFARTLDGALSRLDEVLAGLNQDGAQVIPGEVAFDLYATYGLPLEITRDVAGGQGFGVDEAGFKKARLAHAEASGAGAFGQYDTTDRAYADLLSDLLSEGQLESSGVDYDPYSSSRMESEVVALLREGQQIDRAEAGEKIEVITAATPFYVEAGGEVSDTGWINVVDPQGEVAISDARSPTPGLVAHVGTVLKGEIAVGQPVELIVDDQRRWDIRRNHTATHILHQELRNKLGEHVMQQGSLVAPDRLRFDFSHGEAIDEETMAEVERAISQAILANQPVIAAFMPKDEAIAAGAMALFGEKYGEIVRTIRIGDSQQPYSLELCGGLHVRATGDIGLFRFTSQEAVGAGLRRVEAVTGRGAQDLVNERFATLNRLARTLNAPEGELESRVESLLADQRAAQKELARLRRGQAQNQFETLMTRLQEVRSVPLLVGTVEVAGMEGLREMADWFRERVPSGVAVLATVNDDRPLLVAAVSEDLVRRGLDAGRIVSRVSKLVGGAGGGRPTLAQAGGKNVRELPAALEIVPGLVKEALAP